MTFDFARLIAHAATTRHLAAGTIVGSGTVANDAAREESVHDRLVVPRRAAHAGDALARRAEHALAEVRRPGADRDAWMTTAARSSARSSRRSCATPRRPRETEGCDHEQSVRFERRPRAEADLVRRDRPRLLRLHRRRRSQFRRDRRRRQRHGDRRPGDAGDGGAGDRARPAGDRQADPLRGAQSLPCRARARRLGLSRRRDPRLRRHPGADRRARQGGLGQRIRPVSAAVPGGRVDPRPDLADHDLPRASSRSISAGAGSS